MSEVSEELNPAYRFGSGMNSLLKMGTEDLLSQAVDQYEQTNVLPRLLTSF